MRNASRLGGFLPLLLPCVLLVCSGAVAADDAPDGLTESTGYRVGIEDVLQIFVYEEPDLTMSVRVRPDGMITVPMINDLYVAGRTPESIRKQITERLTQFIQVPVVTVIVEEINSYRVYFLGEVETQGALQFYSPTRLLQGVSTAGGLTSFSSKRITLVRHQNGDEVRIPIDYKKLLSGDPGQENLVLRPDDMLLFH